MHNTDWLQILIIAIVFILVVAAIYCIWIFGWPAVLIIATLMILGFLVNKFIF